MDKAKAVRHGEELNWDKLEIYLREGMSKLEGKMEVAQFHGGHANLTYLIKFGNRELVLRRPPFGKIAPGAHDMKREYKVLSRLYAYFPQAPRAFLLCEDDSVIGAKFVVMERRTGVVVRYKVPEVFKSFENVEERLTKALMKTTADLHKVDVDAAGLSDLGRPEGFVNRQLEGWEKRWHLSKTEENPDMDKVVELLTADIPVPQAVAIIHNDIKLDNCQFQPDNPDQVTSFFDWDMTTLGDPLIDFGSALSYWPDPRTNHIKNMPIMLEGPFPPKSFLIEKYGEFTGFSMENIDWYQSFAYWKNAIILQQLYKRFVDGATKDKRMEALGDLAKVMGAIARQIAESRN
ncbi:MAG: phosphotransferase family protein [Bacteroidota bacterium]